VQPIVIERADDPRIADYVALSDPEVRVRLEEREQFFVAEGPLVVRTLLGTSHRVRSVLVTPQQYDALADVLPALDAPVYVVAPAVMRETVGFDLHRGAVAAADRFALPSLDDVLAGASRVAVLERVNDHENLGGIFRNAAAFGVDAVVLCPQCSDPLYRRSVRVSIGHVLTVPWTRASPWPGALHALAARGFDVLALTPAAGAERLDEYAPSPDAAAKVAVVLGAEGPGLSNDALGAATRRVRIAMAAGIDSLNVSVAAAVAFHHLARRDRLT
jgi:tRNA G18 (ribose-2'-O)-methylase SpoU